MSEIFFFARILVVTMVAVLLMQVRWGDQTIEDHTMAFLTTSTLVAPIDETAQAAGIFIRNGWNRVTKSINTRFSHSVRGENQPGLRLSGLSFNRSDTVERKREAELNAREQQFEIAREEAESAFEKLKRRAREAGSKIRSKFIDETQVPGRGDAHASAKDRSRASASSDEDDAMTE